jgi:hypothetical protein
VDIFQFNSAGEAAGLAAKTSLPDNNPGHAGEGEDRTDLSMFDTPRSKTRSLTGYLDQGKVDNSAGESILLSHIMIYPIE